MVLSPNIELITLVLFTLGFVVLIIGGELLVSGVSRLTASMRVSPLVIGLTVVAFCTSAPKLALSILAIDTGHNDLVIGTVIGSNIANILLILGVAALIAPLIIKQQLVIVDVPLLIIASLLVWVFTADGHMSRVEGVMLIIGLLGYLILAMIVSEQEQPSVQVEYTETYAPPAATPYRLVLSILQIIFGVGTLVVGASWLVNGAAAIAKALGVGELVIGLTILAIGISLPELTTSIMASLHGERDIAAGNVFGSCIFNILGIWGATAFITPNGLTVPASALYFDLVIMIASAIACLPISFSGNRIVRWKGAVFVSYYLAYMGYRVFIAIQQPMSDRLSIAAWWFAVSLTIITLLTLIFRQIRADHIDAIRD